MYDHFNVVEHDDEQKLFSSWFKGWLVVFICFHISFPSSRIIYEVLFSGFAPATGFEAACLNESQGKFI